MANKHQATVQAEENIIFSLQNLGLGSAIGQVRRGYETIKKKVKNRSVDETHTDRIYKMARKSTQVLFRTKTVFPFDFFPDTLTINANKIDIVNSNFFGSHQTTSVPLRDIANVEIQTSPFFATLTIINIRYPMHPLILRYLRRYDAMKAKNIIDGLMVAMSQGADIAQIEPADLIREIELVGGSAVNN